MEKIIVSVFGLGLIGSIWWFFFGKKEKAVLVSQNITIVVDGGYQPNIIKLPKNKPVSLTFIRKDSNNCLEELVFPDYKVKKYLPLNKPVTVTLSVPHHDKSGWYCGMNMFHGRIEIV